MQRYILTLSCPDRMGIVAAVAGFLLERRCNIVASAQFGDPTSREFFMRVSFDADPALALDPLRAAFAPLAKQFAMQSAIYDVAVKSRVVLLVSRFGHCLNDLLYRYRIGALPIEIPAIVSNHRDFQSLAALDGIPFHYLPVEPVIPAEAGNHSGMGSRLRGNDGGLRSNEQALLGIVRDATCDLVVLARYMQILSPAMCRELEGRAINIHHSFLPSFQGASPYKQAHDRGVKLIGATAHYVTEALDEGPIIEQDVARVDHSMSVDDCVSAGRDVECAVLARAVQWHVEHRILLNGNRTVIFR